METTTTPTTAATANTAETDQCAQMFTPPQKEHAWLQKLLGAWTFESECLGEPGQPTAKFSGKETVKALGGLWIVGEGAGEMPGGGTGLTMITLGFDPKRNRFVGTWVGSMMTHLWVYEGELDTSGRVLTLNAEGPSFTDPGKQAKYQDVIEIKSDDHRILTSRTLGDDGTWTQFMTAHYRRQK
ncbi:MAG TPA: DUF1579 domain-containing protein [Opitutaceae bacterium]